MMAGRDELDRCETNACFRTTQWTVVLRAKENNGSASHGDLSTVCEIYWPPIYAYLRRLGHSPADAEDLTQGFFAHLLEKGGLRNLQQQKGKFRSFLLTCLKNFAQNARDKDRAQKRGGGQILIPLEDIGEAERHFHSGQDLSPDQIFEARWAEAIMQRVIERLRKIYVDAGKEELFQRLREVTPGERDTSSYAQIGQQLGLSEGAIKTAVHRMRRRYRELVRNEIASTVSNPDEVEEEIRHLKQALSR